MGVRNNSIYLSSADGPENAVGKLISSLRRRFSATQAIPRERIADARHHIRAPSLARSPPELGYDILGAQTTPAIPRCFR